MKAIMLRMKYKIKHVGIIPDGGRRWAHINKCDLLQSYDSSFEKLILILKSMEVLDIKEVTIYLSSKSNFQRTKEEVFAFCKSETKFISKLNEIDRFNIQIIGCIDIVPQFMKNEISQIKKYSKSDTNLCVNLLIGFEPYEYYFQMSENANSTIQFIANLSTKLPVDIIFRSGGSSLLSGFLPLESSNATLVTLEELFNDISVETFSGIINKENNKIKKHGI